MKCPKCQQEMKVVEKRVTNNGKMGENYKEYQRILYLCKQDDIWITVETPI